MKKLAFILFAFFVFSACTSSNNMETEMSKEETAKNSIFVQIKEPEISRASLSEIQIVNLMQSQPTVPIPTEGFVEIPYDEFSGINLAVIPYASIYPILTGDSIVVTYTDTYPQMEVLNNDTYTYEEINFANELSRKGINILEFFHLKIFDMTKDSHEENYQKMLNEIDRALQANEIRQAYADWLKKEAHCAYLTLFLHPNFIKEHAIDFAEYINKDEDLPYGMYQEFMTKFISYKLDKRFTPEQVPAVVNEYLTGQTRDYILYYFTKLGFENVGNQKAIQASLANLEGQFQDETYFEALKEYQDVFESNMETTDLVYKADGYENSLNNVLESLKGKPVYIDFWASWCVPCRIEFPASRLLHEKYGDKVHFVYISIDRIQGSWIKANTEEGFENQQSYWMANPEKSEFKNRFKINAIPRYFLINKEGEIVNQDAPRPGDETIESLLNSVL